MFALLQVLPVCNADKERSDDVCVSDAEHVFVIKVDMSEDRLKEYAAAYQFRFRAAVEDWEALDPSPEGEWGPGHERLLCDKYRVTGVLAEETTFHIVEAFDGGDGDDADNEPAPLVSGTTT